jgi:hypothetical protein
MLGLLVFVGSFASFFGITFVFQNLPPGNLIIDFFRNSESYLIAGISGDLLVSAIVNGLIWSIIITVVYSYLRGPKRDKKDLPVWVPGYTTSNNSKD